MSLSVWADWAAIVSTLLAAGATSFAGWQVYQARTERKRDLRFMYAKKAGELRERISLIESHLWDIDMKLSHDCEGEQGLMAIVFFRNNLRGLKLHEILHEANIIAAMGRRIGLYDLPCLIVKYFSALDTLCKEMSFAESLRDNPEKGDGRLKIAYQKDALDFAQNDYENIQADLAGFAQGLGDDEVVSRHLLSHLSDSIKSAYT